MKFNIYKKKKKGFLSLSKVFLLFRSKLSHLIPEIHVLLAALRVILDIRLRIQLSRVQGGCICARRVQERVRLVASRATGRSLPTCSIHRSNHGFEIQLRSSFRIRFIVNVQIFNFRTSFSTKMILLRWYPLGSGFLGVSRFWVLRVCLGANCGETVEACMEDFGNFSRLWCGWYFNTTRFGWCVLMLHGQWSLLL